MFFFSSICEFLSLSLTVMTDIERQINVIFMGIYSSVLKVCHLLSSSSSFRYSPWEVNAVIFLHKRYAMQTTVIDWNVWVEMRLLCICYTRQWIQKATKIQASIKINRSNEEENKNTHMHTDRIQLTHDWNDHCFQSFFR